MPKTRSAILLVEDQQADADLMHEVFGESSLHTQELRHVQTLGAAIEIVSSERFDAILLDLSLPDSDFTETVERMRGAAPTTPVVVLSGSDQEDVITRALRCGAQDYLIKGQLDGELLRRAIVYSTERQRLLNEIEQERREREQLHREYAHLETLLAERSTDTTASMFGLAPVWRTAPDQFEALRSLYEQLLDVSLDVRMHRQEHDGSRHGPMLDEIVELLGTLRGGPRDVLDMHTQASKRRLASVNPKKAAAYLEEGRYLLIQVMGRLVNYYRSNPIVLRATTEEEGAPHPVIRPHDGAL